MTSESALSKLVMGKETLSSIELSSESDAEDDLITLNGCGVQTVWRFPTDLKHCPNLRCGLEFGVRSDVIVHYKKCHASHSILCPICDKPISAQSSKDFKSHHKKIHPNEELPYDLGAKRKRKAKSSIETKNKKKDERTESETYSEAENEDSNVDDLITLNGCGHITQWQFPRNQKHCPSHTCCEVFKSRSAAISHYQEKHADHSILCSICNKPIALSVTNGRYHSRHNILNHYERMHPNTKVPYDFGDCNEVTEATEDGNFESVNDDQKDLLCPLKDCNFKWKRTVELREHWNRAHSYLRFPELREESEFTYSTTESEENVHCPVSSSASVQPSVSTMEAESSSNAFTTGASSNTSDGMEPESSTTAYTTEPKSSSSSNWRTTEPEMTSTSTMEPETSANDAYTGTELSTQEESSISIVQRDDFGSDDSLLEPFRTSDIGDSSSSQDSSNEDDLDCTQCNRSFQSVAGLRRHSMIQHNIHSIRSGHTVQKRKRPKPSSSESSSTTGHMIIKKEKMESNDSDDDNIPLTELMKANSQNDMLLEMECMVVIEKMNPIPSRTPSLVSTQIDAEEENLGEEGEMVEAQAYDVVQEEEVDEKPLDLSIRMRQVDDTDIISISDTEDVPIIISDDSDNETDTELGKAQNEQQMNRQADHMERAERVESTDTFIEIIQASGHVSQTDQEAENKGNEENIHCQAQSPSMRRKVCPINFPVQNQNL
ncbi:zinc finger protein 271-like [Sitodiplosis mosellana]|uniref:zinc finger protein 271-like n=1 Tax=Sitodiplosis mosellana TaxID=263140 RepID=UPI0024452307|nr:zinc finger protein 271-like [Sitodiplosis mosellana]